MMVGRREFVVVVVPLWLLWLAAVVGQNEPDLTECEELGLEAGKFAYLGPCAKLKFTCPVPSSLVRAQGSRPWSKSQIPASLVAQVVRSSCQVLFKTACKKSALEALFGSNDEECKDILTNPQLQQPSSPPDCRTFNAAVQIFRDALSRVCDSQPNFAVNSLDRIVSERRPAFQSTTMHGHEASRAVDGNLVTAGNCTRTGLQGVPDGERTSNPWWAVDLEAIRSITRVRITNRDCCGERLYNFEIRVTNSAPFGNGKGDPIREASLCQSGLSIPQGKTMQFNCTGKGRYVIIRIPGKKKTLSLCEVQVYARVDDKPILMRDTILSKGKPTRQLSSLHDAVSSRAVDGIKNTDFRGGSCTRTGFDARMHYSLSPWWFVDLEQSQRVSSVRITRRSDCCHTRLQNFEIRLGRTRPYGKGGQNEVCATGSTIPPGQTYQFECRGIGRYVTVRIPGKRAILTLCEVEVVG